MSSLAAQATHAKDAPSSAPWLQLSLDLLRGQAAKGIGYAKGGQAASEPTAIASLALAAHGDGEHAAQMAARLAEWQGSAGSVGVRPGEAKPAWPTSLALVAWKQCGARFDGNVTRAKQWLLAEKGLAGEITPDVGHNAALIGWSWAENTHSWLEPTAFAVLALRAAGAAGHARTREAVLLLNDRLLDSGGCNYGNTTVLGNELRAHVQPTGIVLLAVSGGSGGPKVAKAAAWLAANTNESTSPTSLGWAVLGLRAHGALPGEAEDWLAAAAMRVMGRDQSPAKLALLALAAKGWPETEGAHA